MVAVNMLGYFTSCCMWWMMKAGEMSRALELCFLLKQYDVLYQIADDLTQDTSPEMITRVCYTHTVEQL